MTRSNKTKSTKKDSGNASDKDVGKRRGVKVSGLLGSVRSFAGKTFAAGRRLGIASVVIVVISFAGGLLLGYGLWHDGGRSSESNKASRNDKKQQAGKQQRGETPADALDNNYRRSQEAIQKDEGSGRLTKEKADAARAKLEEVYNFVKSQGEVETDSKDTREKRRELTSWAREQGMSSSYFTRLF